MENRSHALIAGFFTLLLGVATALALWWFGEKHEETHDYLVVTTKNIAGLNVQAQVRYRGIRVGKVEEILFDRDDFRQTLIRIRIRDDIPVTAGTEAQLGIQGVTGIAHIQLEDDGDSPTRLLATKGALPRIPMKDSMLQEVADVGRETLIQVNQAVSGINQLLNPENQQAIAKTLANLESVSHNAQIASEQMRQLLSQENLRLLRSSLRGTEYTLNEAGAFFSEARGLVGRWQTLGGKLDTALIEPASAGMTSLAPRINELGNELASTSRQLSRVLQMLEESPQSLIFGQQKPVPGPGEAGFTPPTNQESLP